MANLHSGYCDEIIVTLGNVHSLNLVLISASFNCLLSGQTSPFSFVSLLIDLSHSVTGCTGDRWAQVGRNVYKERVTPPTQVILATVFSAIVPPYRPI